MEKLIEELLPLAKIGGYIFITVEIIGLVSIGVFALWLFKEFKR